jgi:hypothetical protein
MIFFIKDLPSFYRKPLRFDIKKYELACRSLLCKVEERRREGSTALNLADGC